MRITCFADMIKMVILAPWDRIFAGGFRTSCQSWVSNLTHPRCNCYCTTDFTRVVGASCG